MKKIIVYPYTNRVFSTIENMIIGRYDEVVYCVPKDKYLDGKDLSILDNREKIGKKLNIEVKRKLKDVSALIIVDNIWCQRVVDDVITTIEQALRQGIDVYICSKHIKLAKETSEKYVDQIFWMNKNISDEKEISVEAYYKYIKSPVLFIANMFTESDSYEIAVNITENLKRKGLKILTLVNSYEGKLLDYICIKDIFDSCKSIEENISLINAYVSECETEEKFDLIIVEIPGGLYPYNTYLRNDVGTYFYMINKAIPADYIILCSMFDLYEKKFFENIKQDIENQFSSRLFAVHLSRKILDVDLAVESHKFGYLYVDEKRVIKERNLEREIPIFNGIDRDDIEFICKKLMDADSRF